MSTEPIDLPVDVTVEIRPRVTLPVTSPNGRPPRKTVSTPNSAYLTSLSPTQAAVVQLVTRYGQLTTSQARRSIYVGTPRGVIARSSRHLKALSERGFIHRLPYKLSGWSRGSGECVYAPSDSKARIPNLHTLDITELFVRLHETGKPVSYDPEPWCHTSWGGHKVTPDAYVKLPGAHYFLEIDRSSESPSAISAKMNRYVNAYNGMDGGTFPLVVWLAHDTDRVRTLQREANKKLPELFRCQLFNDALEVLK